MNLVLLQALCRYRYSHLYCNSSPIQTCHSDNQRFLGSKSDLLTKSVWGGGGGESEEKICFQDINCIIQVLQRHCPFDSSARLSLYPGINNSGSSNCCYLEIESNSGITSDFQGALVGLVLSKPSRYQLSDTSPILVAAEARCQAMLDLPRPVFRYPTAHLETEKQRASPNKQQVTQQQQHDNNGRIE